MTVEELIKNLLRFPKDAQIEIVIPGDIYIATSREFIINKREDGYVELISPL